MPDLVSKLKALRLELAKDINLPAYCVFDNKAIEEIDKLLPVSFDELKNIKGFGEKRIEKYGELIIELIKEHLKEQGIKKEEIALIKEEIKKEEEKNNIDIENIILSCIQKFNSGFGKSGVVKVLKGFDFSRSNYYTRMYYECAINSEFYGVLKNCTKKEIETALDKLIEENKVLKTGGLKPTLKICETDYTKIKPKKLEATQEINLNPYPVEIQNKTREFHENFLKETFGYEKFHDNQWRVIKEVLNQKRVLIIEKTGFGKSLCYQYPSELFYKESKGLTVVFSPLLSLIRDQVNSLKSKGLKAECIIGEQSFEDNLEILKQAASGKISTLFISPERLNSNLWLNYLNKIKLSFVVIDEAHCISQWGHDFRPSYRRILNLINSLPSNFPILALTATATGKIIDDIKVQLGNNLKIIKGSLNRVNLQLHSIPCKNTDEKLYWILRIIQNLEGSGLVYCARKADTVMISDWLNYNGVKSCFYHGGLEKEQRQIIEQEFFENKYKAIASTNALGMGVDKKDIRFIIHLQISENLMSYYQEIGRAGRDGKMSQAILLYNSKDKDLAKFFIDNARPKIEKYRFAIKKMAKKPYLQSDLARELALDESEINTLLNDLLDQNIVIKEDKAYSTVENPPKLDEDYFIFQTQQKLKELEKMVNYAKTLDCRMKYLCDYFEDEITPCGLCDNCKRFKFRIKDFETTKEKLDGFYKKYGL